MSDDEKVREVLVILPDDNAEENLLIALGKSDEKWKSRRNETL